VLDEVRGGGENLSLMLMRGYEPEGEGRCTGGTGEGVGGRLGKRSGRKRRRKGATRWATPWMGVSMRWCRAERMQGSMGLSVDQVERVGSGEDQVSSGGQGQGRCVRMGDHFGLLDELK
jgi:hypothetical protein